MFFLGLLSIIQGIFLPGFAILGFSRGLPLALRIVFAFPVSLVFNHHAVFLLSLLGLYRRPAVFALMALEVGALGWLLLKRRSPAPPLKLGNPLAGLSQARFLFGAAGFLLMAAAFWKEGGRFAGDLGMPFVHWDAFTWDRWAHEWDSGAVPRGTLLYPQLLPILYSLTYKITGEPGLQLFARALTGAFQIFSMGSLLLMALLSVEGALIYPLTAHFLILFLNKTLPGMVYSGYADAPLTYFPVALMLCFELGRNRREEAVQRALPWLTAAVIAGGAFTKQGGLFLLVCGPFALARPLSVLWRAVALTAPWFIHRFVYVLQGKDMGNRPALESLLPPSYIDRLRQALAYVRTSFPTLPPALLLGVFHRRALALAILFTVPYGVIWALTASYAERNLAMALPGFAYSTAAALFTVFAFLEKMPCRAWVWAARAVGVAALLYGFMHVPSAKHLWSLQKEGEWARGNGHVNGLLREHLARHPGVPFYSNDAYHELIPALAGKRRPWPCESADCVASFQAKIPEFFLLLSPATPAGIETGLAPHKVFESYGYRFYYKGNH